MILQHRKSAAEVEVSLSDFTTNQSEDDWIAESVGCESGDRLLDSSLRHSYRWRGGAIKLTELTSGACANSIQQAAKTFLNLNPDQVRFKLEAPEILLYPPGGHFVDHEDRELFEGQLGTLLIIGFSSDASGGELTLSRDGSVIVSLDKCSAPFVRASDFKWKCCILKHKCKHSVKPLGSGLRIVFRSTVRLVSEAQYQAENPAIRPSAQGVLFN